MLLKTTLIFSCLSFCIAFSLTRQRFKREAYFLPDDVETYMGKIRSTFKCQQSFGYFADVDNNCQLFHLCVPDETNTQANQYTFACGNQTVFNQFSLTCSSPDESIPCASSPDFFYLNDRIGQVKNLFHEDQDMEKMSNYLTRKS